MYLRTVATRDEAVGVVPPPPGIAPNFINPPSLQQSLVATNITFIFVSTPFVLLRLYTSRFILRRVDSSDYLILAAWVFAVVSSSLSVIMARFGLGLHLWDVPFEMFNMRFGLVGSMVGLFYGMSIMLSKLSILAFYLRFSVQKTFKRVVFVVMLIVVLYSVLASFDFVYRCRPIKKHWDLTVTGGSCINANIIYIFSGAMNTATDLTILVLPIGMLRKLRLPRRQKFGAIFLLMSGGVVLIFSIFRLWVTVRASYTYDITWAGTLICISWEAEMHMAMICACLPFGKAFYRRHLHGVFGSSDETSPHDTTPTYPLALVQEYTTTTTACDVSRLSANPSKSGDGRKKSIPERNLSTSDEDIVSRTNGSMCSTGQVPVQVRYIA